MTDSRALKSCQEISSILVSLYLFVYLRKMRQISAVKIYCTRGNVYTSIIPSTRVVHTMQKDEMVYNVNLVRNCTLPSVPSNVSTLSVSCPQDFIATATSEIKIKFKSIAPCVTADRCPLIL